ncbi:MAG: head GIN domain-containing protein [Bacteroidales bacterium]
MKKILLPLILLGIFSALCITQIGAWDAEKELKFTETRTISKFNSIRVSSIFDVYISPGNSSELKIRSTHNLAILNKIKTDVVNGELIISFKDANSETRKNNFRDLQIKIYVSTDKINMIKASGASDIYSNGLLNADNLEICASGASDVNLNVVVKGTVKCVASGSSDIILLGNADSGDIKASGASDVDCKKFPLKSVKAVASGSSDIYLNVLEKLDVTASGASDIFYIGNPQITNCSSSGSSEINHR